MQDYPIITKDDGPQITCIGDDLPGGISARTVVRAALLLLVAPRFVAIALSTLAAIIFLHRIYEPGLAGWISVTPFATYAAFALLAGGDLAFLTRLYCPRVRKLGRVLPSPDPAMRPIYENIEKALQLLSRLDRDIKRPLNIDNELLQTLDLLERISTDDKPPESGALKQIEQITSNMTAEIDGLLNPRYEEEDAYERLVEGLSDLDRRMAHMYRAMKEVS